MDVHHTTKLLRDWSGGEEGAFDALFDRVYGELKSIAHNRLIGQRRGETINTTVLVHEAYLKLVDSGQSDLNDRAHFLAVASRAMRFILVDYARAKSAQKRGGDQPVVSVDDVQIADGAVASALASVELIELSDALEQLAEMSPRLNQVVECRFFGGMEYTEIAAVTGRSVPTVKRDWARARAWMYEFMTEAAPRP